MFDVGFSELMLIGLVALIVIGPERLPKVARTIGHLVGRAQRYVSDVKTDIQREMDLSDLNDLKNQMQDAAQSVKSSMQEATESLRKPLDEAQQALNEASASVDALVHSAKAEAGPPTEHDVIEAAQASASATPASATPASATTQAAAATPAVEYEHQPLAEPPGTAPYEPEVVTPAPAVAPAAQAQKADSAADKTATTPVPGTRP